MAARFPSEPQQLHERQPQQLRLDFHRLQQQLEQQQQRRQHQQQRHPPPPPRRPQKRQTSDSDVAQLTPLVNTFYQELYQRHGVILSRLSLS